MIKQGLDQIISKKYINFKHVFNSSACNIFDTYDIFFYLKGSSQYPAEKM